MTTPARRQYLRIKKEHEDAILLFRMGDFYETFDDDARVVSRELEIALTAREMGRGHRVPLAGIPYHALDSYLARLIKKGFRVAICEQTSDPAKSRGLVDREVVRIVTPGTVVEDSILDQKVNNYLAAALVDGASAGLAYVDITTSEFYTTHLPADDLAAELGRLRPAEVLTPELGHAPANLAAAVTTMEDGAFHVESAREALLGHFESASLEAYGCESLPLATSAAGAIIDYLGRNNREALAQITTLRTYSTASYMVLDPQTRRNLELFEGGRWGDRDASLFSVLDQTRTSMGGRLLRTWLGQPLLDLEELRLRQDAVAWFHRSTLRRGRVRSVLDSVSDMERLINRVRGSGAVPRDLVGLRRSLEAVPELRLVLEEDEDSERVGWLARQIGREWSSAALIGSAIVDDPPLTVGEGRVIRKGYSPELDDLMGSTRGAQAYIAGLQNKERERTGIKTLKVGYNKVFGYYIEVSKSYVDQVPDDYVRRQTLVGGERYITPEMKEYESRILSAQESIAELETSLFRQVCEEVGLEAQQIIDTARAVAMVDVLAGMAEAAELNGYVRPELNDGEALEIVQGRHPVVERSLPSGSFVPNDARLSTSDEQVVILTGPNMAGKSTFIRQVAIITLMAQTGSFVPADSATIGLVDRIFTRVGLQDDLAVGQSTFMVEMVETAAILNHATPRSLVVLDEIGRGTSTYDGLAIAHAVAEYVHSNARLGCKTLFATHYHELTELADFLPRARNYNVAVSDSGDSVVFLRRIVPGGADRSYGVHVARLAGLPEAVIDRASEVLGQLENGADGRHRSGRRRVSGPAPKQLQLIPTHPAIDSLLKMDVASMTPLEAINRLSELQEQAKEPRSML